MRHHDKRSVIMVRTQIQLTEEQAERLKAVAARRGVSLAELIRQGVDILLERGGEKSIQDLRLKAAKAAGSLRSGRHDIAVRHDDYLGEDFAG